MVVTTSCLQVLAEQNVAVVVCDGTHMPAAQLLPFAAHSTAQETVEAQLGATSAVQGRLWRQIVRAKLLNQSELLVRLGRPNALRLKTLVDEVKNGDPSNCEAQGARLYFQSIKTEGDFLRDQEGGGLNAALNYGYAVLRAAVARALVGSGLVCFRGVHHHNRYNPFCLADDVMEPYRPFVDQYVFGDSEGTFENMDDGLTRAMKARLLQMLTCDVRIGSVKRPLMLGVTSTTASLAKYYLGKTKELALPSFA
jgi:CRISPR-associated protein Cas1